LVRTALRSRPDRIIVGQVRGGEALDMLQAMNTGHEGSLPTAHANSPRDLLSRLETMALMSDVDLPVMHVREQIAGALDLIVHMTRLRDGRRAIARISALEGLRGGSIMLQDMFTWRRGSHAGFQITGVMSSIMHLLEEREERVDPRIFGELAADPLAARSAAARPDAVRRGPAPSRSTGRPDAHSPDVLSRPGAWAGSLRSLGSALE